jgi:hypothetical protein
MLPPREDSSEPNLDQVGSTWETGRSAVIWGSGAPDGSKAPWGSLSFEDRREKLPPGEARKSPTQYSKEEPESSFSFNQDIKTLSTKIFCNVCEVEYTWSVMRRYQLGYINLISPVTHVWYLKGNPSYLSILLDMKKRHLEYIVYCSETLTLENSLKGRISSAIGPKSSDIVSSWKKLKEKILLQGFLGQQPTPSSQGRGCLPLEGLKPRPGVAEQEGTGPELRSKEEPARSCGARRNRPGVAEQEGPGPELRSKKEPADGTGSFGRFLRAGPKLKRKRMGVYLSPSFCPTLSWINLPRLWQGYRTRFLPDREF